jgi:hypothetical protein
VLRIAQFGSLFDICSSTHKNLSGDFLEPTIQGGSPEAPELSNPNPCDLSIRIGFALSLRRFAESEEGEGIARILLEALAKDEFCLRGLSGAKKRASQ